MIRVTVELVPGGVGEPETLGTLELANDGLRSRQNRNRGDYTFRMLSKRGDPLRGREGIIEDYPRLTKPVWCLVVRALVGAGYR